MASVTVPGARGVVVILCRKLVCLAHFARRGAAEGICARLALPVSTARA